MDQVTTARRPATPILLDDIRVGDVFDLGSHELTREEVIDFARRFDPQPYHLDDAVAEANPVFGRIAASGWHSTMIINRLTNLFVQSARLNPLSGLGADNVRWLSPAYPGDVLTGLGEFLVVRPSQSDPARRVVVMRSSLTNQHGVLVASADIAGIFSPEPASPGA